MCVNPTKESLHEAVILGIEEGNTVLPTTRHYIAAFALLSMASGSQAAALRAYETPIHDAGWSTRSSLLECSLSQKIPFYGSASFEAKAGGRVNLIFEAERDQPLRASHAVLRSEPPAWRELPVKDIAVTQIRPGKVVASFDRQAAMRALYELEQGMSPTLRYKDWVDASEPVKVSLSTVRMHSAMQEFQRCMASLHPDGYEDVNDKTLYFSEDRIELEQLNSKELDRIASYMALDPTIKHVVIGGHTDNLGTKHYNEELSQMRVDAVRDYLVEKGIEPEKLVTIYYGEKLPLKSNKTAEGRAKNRRVTLELRR